MTNLDYKELLQRLSQVIEESLGLLKQAAIVDQQKLIPSNTPVTSLLDQCLALCEQYHADAREPVRSVHHFGLPRNSPLISSLATLPNTRILKDIHPNNSSFKDNLKTQTLQPKKLEVDFQTQDIAVDQGHWLQVFLNDLQYLQQQSNTIGQRLLICDNHCLPQTIENKPMADLLTLLDSHFVTRRLIIVTDPLDGYQAYCELSQPDQPQLSFDDYCQRILAFIQAHQDVTVIKHEDFIAAPTTIMKQICAVLELPFNEDFMLLREAYSR